MNDDDEINVEHDAQVSDPLSEIGQMTQLEMSFTASHEAFAAAMTSGFTRLEALYLVACMLSGGPQLPRSMES
jgi:hypothetical protein